MNNQIQAATLIATRIIAGQSYHKALFTLARKAFKAVVSGVEIKNTSTGFFTVYNNGAETGYFISNGNEGISGKGNNVYGIQTPCNGFKVIGSLAKCKKLVTLWVK